MSTGQTQTESRPGRRQDIASVISSKFKSEIEPEELSSVYKMSITLAAFVMLLLPLVYIGIVIGFGYFSFSLTLRTGHFLPPLIGGVLLIFMIKPLFAPKGQSGIEQIVTEETQPILFSFVSDVCEAVGSPEPSEIVVMTDVNASASLRRGLLSVITGDLRLRIGLPLVTRLTVTELAGVLAHEFGHFSQGAGMRLSYLIAVINGWFERVVYQRDKIDDLLVGACKRGTYHTIALAWSIRLLVWVTRRVLWLLMLLAHAVSCYMSRQMEYDADMMQIKLTGSKKFGETFDKIIRLSVANSWAFSNIGHSWQEKRICDDLMALTSLRYEKITEKDMEEIKKNEEEEKASWFDTHPLQSLRNERADEAEEEGVFSFEKPARCLFKNFAGLCRVVTISYYKQILGDDYRSEFLVASEKYLKSQKSLDKTYDTMRRYTQGLVCLHNPVLIEPDNVKKPADVKAAAALMKKYYSAIKSESEKYSKVNKKFIEVDGKVSQIRLAMSYIDAKIGIKPKDFGLKSRKRADVENELSEKSSIKKMQQESMQRFAEKCRKRLELGLQIYCHPAISGKMAQRDKVIRDIRDNALMTKQLTRQFEQFSEIIHRKFELQGFVITFQDAQDNKKLYDLIIANTRKLHDLLIEVYNELVYIDYPFEHANGRVNVGEYAVEEMPPSDNPIAVVQVCDEMLDKVMSLYYRVLGRLMVYAEKVEKAVKLEPLPEPKEEEEQEQKQEA